MDVVHARLALKLGKGSAVGDLAIGWCLLEERGKLPEKRLEGKVRNLILREVRPGEHVELIGYADAESFSYSQARRDGLSWKKHTEKITKLVRFLLENGRSASIKWISVKS